MGLPRICAVRNTFFVFYLFFLWVGNRFANFICFVVFFRGCNKNGPNNEFAWFISCGDSDCIPCGDSDGFSLRAPANTTYQKAAMTNLVVGLPVD
jgi:hypothetical protein